MDVFVWGFQEKSTSPRSKTRVVAFVKDMTMYESGVARQAKSGILIGVPAGLGKVVRSSHGYSSPSTAQLPNA
jgi:hypothetical protein